MDVTSKKLFRVLACCELMQTDHQFTVKTKKGEKTVFVRGDRLRFLTLTVPESRLPLFEVAARFRRLANSRWWRDLMRCRSYVCVYEPHPGGHGWHIHILTNTFVPWQELDVVSRAYLFGHTDIEVADTSCAYYIAKYVTKSYVLRKAQDSRNVRIVNVSRDLLPLYDIEARSPSADFIRDFWDCADCLKNWHRLHFLYYFWVYTWSGAFLAQGIEAYTAFEKLNQLQK